MSPQRTGNEQNEHLQTLKEILKESKSDADRWISQDAAGYFEALLAIYYRSEADDTKARQLLQREIKNSLDMLSDVGQRTTDPLTDSSPMLWHAMATTAIL